MPRGKPKKKPRRPRHASLSRPYGEFVEALPEGARIQTQQTPWQYICQKLANNPGRWFLLDQTYKNGTSSAMNSARKTLEADYDGDVASTLQAAALPDGDTGRFYIYLRLNLPRHDEGEGDDEVEDEDFDLDDDDLDDFDG